MQNPNKLHALTLCLGTLISLPAAAQSDTPSQASAISLAPSLELAAVTLSALPAGSELIVRSVERVGEFAVLTVSAAAQGVSFVVEISARTAAVTGLAVGTVLSMTALAGGTLVSLAGQAIAFVPDQACRALIHHRALSQ